MNFRKHICNLFSAKDIPGHRDRFKARSHVNSFAEDILTVSKSIVARDNLSYVKGDPARQPGCDASLRV
jgi:hypothetical protein